MKKLFILLSTFCLLAGLSITSAAAEEGTVPEPTAKEVLKVTRKQSKVVSRGVAKLSKLITLKKKSSKCYDTVEKFETLLNAMKSSNYMTCLASTDTENASAEGEDPCTTSAAKKFVKKYNSLDARVESSRQRCVDRNLDSSTIAAATKAQFDELWDEFVELSYDIDKIQSAIAQ